MSGPSEIDNAYYPKNSHTCSHSRGIVFFGHIKRCSECGIEIKKSGIAK